MEHLLKNMKKLLFLLSIAVLISSSYSGDKSWYKYLTGKVDTSPVTMSIVRYGNEVRGYYYYDKYKKPIEIFGTTAGDSVTFYAYTSYENSETFRGIMKGAVYSGVWSNTPENKELSFTLNEQKNISSEFEFVYVSGEERLFKDLETPAASYVEGTFWPAENYGDRLFVRNSILKMKNLNTGLTEIGGLLLANKKKFMQGFRTDNAGVKKQEAADGGWSYSQENIDITVPVFFNDNLMVISGYLYTFTGGAHGNYGTGFTNLDLKRKKVLELSDIINKKDLPKLPKLLEKYYKVERGYPQEKTLQELGLFLDTIPVNDNFMVSPGGLMFDYVPYEISSYADGEITITIPFEELSAYIKPEAKQLFK
jgi:hypothetical protein